MILSVYNGRMYPQLIRFPFHKLYGLSGLILLFIYCLIANLLLAKIEKSFEYSRNF